MHVGNAGPFLHKLTIARQGVKEVSLCHVRIARWRAIWLTEILGFEIDEVSLLLQISTKTISRYVREFRMLGHVDTAVIGRPYTCIAMHPHEELVILEVLLQHPEKTLCGV